jgi:hypothetical protein
MMFVGAFGRRLVAPSCGRLHSDAGVCACVPRASRARLSSTLSLLLAPPADNSGADIVLGMLPFARELLRLGCEVVLVANSLPAINVGAVVAAWSRRGPLEQRHKPGAAGAAGLATQHPWWLPQRLLAPPRAPPQDITAPELRSLLSTAADLCPILKAAREAAIRVRHDPRPRPPCRQPPSRGTVRTSRWLPVMLRHARGEHSGLVGGPIGSSCAGGARHGRPRAAVPRPAPVPPLLRQCSPAGRGL